MVHFVLNRIQKSENLQKILEEKALLGTEKIVLLVPEQSSFANERNILKKLGNKNFKNVKVLSFSRLYDFVSQIAKIPPLKPISETKKIMLINRAIELAKPQLSLYKKSTGDTDAATLILNTLMEFKSEKITDKILNRIENLTTKNLLKQKISEIKIIKNHYENITRNKFNDSFDGLNLIEKIAKEKNIFKDFTVFIDEFTDFTAQQLSILEVLITQAKDVYMAFKTSSQQPKDINYDVFSHIEKTIGIIKKLATKNGIKTSVDDNFSNDDYIKQPAEDLSILEKNLFNPLKQKCTQTPKNISIYCAENVLEECEYTANTILKLIMENGYKYKDFTIITRNPEEYESVFKSVFKKYGIPYFLDSHETIFNKNLVNLTFAGIDSIRSNYSAEDILRYLKTKLTNLSAEDVSLIENYILLWDIKGKDWLKEFTMHPEGFKENFDESHKEILKKLNELRKIIITPLENFKKRVKNSTAKGISKALYLFLVDVNTAKNLQKYCAELSDQGFMEASEQSARVWDILMEILNEMAVTFEDTPITLKKYEDILTCAMKFINFSSIPQNSDSVVIGCIDRMRIGNFKIVFVVGTSNGDFPKIPSDSKIFTEQEISHILSLGVELKNSSENFIKKEKFLTYLALTCACEKLYVSWNCAENRLPSEIVKEIKDIFPKVSILNKNSFTDNELIWSEKTAFSWYAKNHKSGSPTSKCLEKYFSLKEKGKTDIIKKVKTADLMHFENPKNASEIIGKNITVSASQIEKYYRCKFEYFCKYILNAQNNVPAKFGNLEYGNIVHFILEKILKKFTQEQIINLSETEIKNEIDDIADKYVQKIFNGEENKSKKFLYAIEKVKNSIFYIINHFKEEFKQTSFKVSDLELEISENGEIKPLVFQDKFGTKIKIEGKIDRVDTLNSDGNCYLRVIDYKTGKKELQLSEVMHGINMQMLIYLFTLQKNGRKKYGNVIPAGVLYFKALKPIGNSKSLKEMQEGKIDETDMQMNGLILDNASIIQKMEKDCGGVFIPAKIVKSKKDGQEKIDSKHLVSLKDMDVIYNHIKKMAINMASELKCGDIAESPVKISKSTECELCEYFPICCYEKNKFNKIPSVKDNKKFLKMMVQEGGEVQDE